MTSGIAVLFLTHVWGPAHALRFRRLRQETAGVATCHVLFQSTGNDTLDQRPADDLAAADDVGAVEAGAAVHVFRAADLPGRLGYRYLTRAGVVPGCVHFPVIDFARTHPYTQYWVIEGDVEFSGDWANLIRAGSASDAGLLATHVCRYRDAPDWTWWSSLSVPRTADSIVRNRPGRRVKALMPVCRISHAALQLVDRLHRSGWTGHSEVLLPTAIGHAGLGVVDLNSLGGFYRDGDQDPVGDAAVRSSMRWRPEITLREFMREFSANTIYHPIKGDWTFDGTNVVIARMGGDSVPAFDVANSMSVRAELGLKLRERTDDVGIAGGIAARAVAPAVCRTRTVKPGDGPWWVGPEGSDAAGWGESPENSAVMQTERRSYHRAYHRGGRLIERLAGAGRKATVSNPATFCISLKDSPRRGAFAALASTHSVAFEFIDAMSTDDVRRGATIGDCRIDITDLRWTHFDRFETRRRHAPLMYSEIGCAYSHMMCWRLAKDRDLDHVCIFEDDAVLCRGLRDIEIPRGADMVYLSNRMPRDCFGKARTPGSGTEGYILTRAGILKCLEIFKVLYMPIDLQLMAHQVSSVKSGFWIAGYRRDLPDDGLLKAYVARRPYCHHPDGGDSEIEPADSRSAAAERDMLRRQLAAMRSSTSWRLTAPIRALKTMFGMWAPGESVSVSARE